jgi:hypothetical protein
MNKLDKKNGILSRSINALHPSARLRFAAPFLLASPRRLGRQGRRRMQEQGLPAPDGVLLSLDPVLVAEERCGGCFAVAKCCGTSMAYDELSRVVFEGRLAGVHLYFLLTRYPLSYHEEILDLGLRYPDCAFVLAGPSAILEGDFLQDLASAGNIALTLNVDGYALETDSLRGAGSYARFRKARDAARQAGAPFGFASCCYNGNLPSVLSSGFLDQLTEDGALFGAYYPYLAPRSSGIGPLHLDRKQLADMTEKVRELRAGSPLTLIDVQRDVSFVGKDARGGLLLHRVNSAIRHLTLLESLERAALGPATCLYPGDPESRGDCPLLHEQDWQKRLLYETLAADQRLEPLSFSDNANEGQWVPVAL